MPIISHFLKFCGKGLFDTYNAEGNSIVSMIHETEDKGQSDSEVYHHKASVPALQLVLP